MKFKPFNKERALAGDKVVIMPDVVTEPEANTLSDVYPFKCKVNGEEYTFTDNGSIYNGEHIGIRLAMLDETPEEVTGEFWRLLEVGEEILEGDEYWDQRSWCSSEYMGHVMKDYFKPIRRRITLPLAPASPWVKYSDRKPTREDGDANGQIVVGSSKHSKIALCQWDSSTKHDAWDMWLKAIPLPKPARDFQKEWVQNLDKLALKVWNFSTPEEQQEIETEWRKENQ